MDVKWGEIDVGKIIAPINGELISGRKENTVKGLSTDSRLVTKGQIFLALRGERFDGHDFIRSVIEKGVSGVIIEKERLQTLAVRSDVAVIEVPDTLKALGDFAIWWRKQHNVRVAAITGSAGKTTVKEMTSGVLELDDRTLKNKGNLNNLIGLPLTLLRLEPEDRMVVLEMGMNQPGEIGRLTEIADPDIGLITNIGRAHLAGLGNIQGVAKAKTELLEKISSESHVVLFGDDALLMENASRFSRKIITYGIGSGNMMRAENIRNMGREGISFRLRYRNESIPIKLKVPGRHNLINALAAASIALCMGISKDKIKRGLEGFIGIEGRFKVMSLPKDITLIDDTYNSNPSSLKAAMQAVKEFGFRRGRIIVGLGDMLELGAETAQAHLEAGGLVAEIGASYFFAIGENASKMLSGALEKGFPIQRAMKVESHQEMTRELGNVLNSGDVILLKGSRKLSLEAVVQGLINRLSKKYSHD